MEKPKSPEQFVRDRVKGGDWVVEMFNENERSFHGHTVLAISGPTGDRIWTQTYDFLGGHKVRSDDPYTVEYTPLDPNAGKQKVSVSGYDEGRGYPDVVFSSRENVGFRQIGASEAVSGRRLSVKPNNLHHQVPGFVRFRAPHGHLDGPVLYGAAVRIGQWAASPEKGLDLQRAINESAKKPPAYAAVCDYEAWQDPHATGAENCHSWAKRMVRDVGLQVSLGASGPMPNTTGNYICYTCGVILVGMVAYMIGTLKR